MSSPRDDLVRLRHMHDAAREALHFAQGKVRKDLDDDRLLALGLLKSIEIIGEAASRISPAARESYPQIPWPDIVGMRNRLVHAYFEIDLDQVWDTVANDLTPLVAVLQPIVKSRP